MKLQIHVLPTPNPNSLKFMLDTLVKTEGKVTYTSVLEASENPLAQELFKIRGVDHLHFFNNSITITKFNFVDWEELEPMVMNCLEEHAPAHNPDFKVRNSEEERRLNLPPELQEIENILDRTVRPGLQADGGDVICVKMQDDVLLIKYQGACGSCPSSSSGTLQAIRSILKDELGRDIDVYIAPE